jgi:hypothetical protein
MEHCRLGGARDGRVDLRHGGLVRFHHVMVWSTVVAVLLNFARQSERRHLISVDAGRLMVGEGLIERPRKKKKTNILVCVRVFVMR